MIVPDYGSIRVTLAKKDDQPPKRRRTTQPGHVDILLPEQQRVSPGEVARPEPVPALSESDERIRRLPPNLGTLGRGRIFVQRPPGAVDPAATPAPPAVVAPVPRRRWPWLLLALLVFVAGAAGGVFRDRIFPPEKPKPVHVAPVQEVARTPLAQIPPAATFFNSGPFDEQRLGDAFFAPDGRRYAFLFREGGEYGFAGAGREKTPNMLDLNGRRIHLGIAVAQEASARRAGYFPATDRFWYLARTGDGQRLILEDDQSEVFDTIGAPIEALHDKEIGYTGKRGDHWFVIVGDWTSAPYDAPIRGPWFSPNGDGFAFLVGGDGERLRRGQRQVVICDLATKACDKRPNNPARAIEEFLQVGNEDELFFALDWYGRESTGDANEDLEKMAISKRGGRWQYAVITRASASLVDVPLGEQAVDLGELAERSGIDRPWVDRIVVSPDGQSIAMVVAGRNYVAGDGIMLHRTKDGQVETVPEYVRCKFASRPFARRDWLVMSKDESKIAYCTLEPAVGERVVINEHKLKPYTFVMSRPVFSPDGQTVAYFAIQERKWYLVAGLREEGPYDELFGEPHFSADGNHIWYGARRGRTIYFVKLSLKPLAQPADATVDL